MIGDDAKPFDLARIVEVFNRHGVAYVAIGAISGMLHGAIHYVTQDVDMMVRSGIENMERTVAALTDLSRPSSQERCATTSEGIDPTLR